LTWLLIYLIINYNYSYNLEQKIMKNNLELDWAKTVSTETKELAVQVSNHVWEVTDIAKLTLNTYEWMDKIVLNSLWWRKIYVKLFVEADDNRLTHKLSNWVLSNFPENKIKNNPELITRNERWNYYFWHNASDNRLKELWMRFLTNEEISSPELSEYIFEKLWNDKKNFPSCRETSGFYFWDIGNNAYFWWDSINEITASCMEIYIGFDKVFSFRYNKSNGVSLLGVKD